MNMLDQPVRRTRTRPKDDLDLDIQDPNISLWDKWNRHVTKKQTTGIIRHAPLANRWAPRGFYFVCLGGTGWIVGGSIPFYYGDSNAWMVGMEAFTIYVFVQVMVNYFLTKNTDSSYQPDTLHQQDHGADHSSVLLQSSSPPTPATGSSQTEVEGPDESDPCGASYRVLVATAVNGTNIERKSFSYWSWVPCVSCNRPRPPRCHHCSLCGKCVLKRDHHCYFTKVCIGVNNHRYYMYFLLWCVVLTWLGSFQLVPYLFTEVLVHRSFLDLFIPFNVYATLMSDLPVHHLHLIVVTWGVVFLTFVSSGMFGNSLFLMLRGITSFERSHDVKIVDTRNYAGRLQSMLGRNWGIEMFITGPMSRKLMPFLPHHLKPSAPLEDAVTWPHIKAI